MAFLSSEENAHSESVYDFIIIGSGFGGSVAAMRLSQKGYKVLVIEKGRRFQKNDFPKTNWNLKKFLWAPLFRCFGIQQMSFLKGVMVLHGAGVGGGSLVYANTLMEPRAAAFNQGAWPVGIDWAEELKDFYAMAKKILGVERNQLESESDREIQKLGQSLGCGSSYHLTDVGVYFGDSKKRGQTVADPYFAGDGPDRAGCTGCGGCMIGCRIGAKNTLDQNYLYFAEKWGARVLAMQTVDRILPLAEDSESVRYQVETSSTQFGIWGRSRRTYRARNVILSAGVLGTVELLLRQKFYHRTLPQISESLGKNVRTNGESLCGVTRFASDRNYSEGVAIGSAIHVDEHTKIEPVRYSPGSSAMRLLAVPLTADGNFLLRPWRMFVAILRDFPKFIKFLFIRDWARQSIILLVMQSLDEKMELRWGRRWFFAGRWGLRGQGAEIPSYLPIAQKATGKLADQVEGYPQNSLAEVLLKMPTTAHILGGAILSRTPSEGVTDLRHQVWNYPGLYVCDGSSIPSNLGVNPSLTITALSERFASFFSSKENFQSPVLEFSSSDGPPPSEI